MSEKEKKIIQSISEAFPKMSDFDKGYLLGAAEQMVSEKENNKEEKEDKKRMEKAGMKNHENGS